MIDVIDKLKHLETLGIAFDAKDTDAGYEFILQYNGGITEITEQQMRDMSIKHIAEVAKGEREPKSLQHVTRIVGYYSNTNNWNASKLAELRDRHKGTYTLGKK